MTSPEQTLKRQPGTDTPDEQRTWLRYWKKSLSDAQAVDIDIEKFRHFEVESFRVDAATVGEIGKVNQLIDFEEVRVNKKKGITNKDNEEWTTIDSIIVLIAPFKLVPVPEQLVYLKDKKPRFPFWYYARLDRRGLLHVPDEVFPVFQRKYLEPLADEKTEFIFTSVENVDKATVLGKEEYQSYSEYLQYLDTVFRQVIGTSITDYRNDAFAVIANAIILLPDEEMNAAFSIIQLYEKLLKAKEIPPLLRHLIQLHHNTSKLPLAVEELIDANHLYMGQMGFKFSLSVSQRKGLYTFLQSKDKVFAINGPPGTGKTTLLQSIVANMVVERALKGTEPPLILACSTNNQAVTNILDSFLKAETAPGTLEGRWLPDIKGYATYLPSNLKSANELKGINYKKLSGEGFFSAIENHTYLVRAKASFVQKGNEHYRMEVLDIPEILRKLQTDIQSIQASIQQASALWKSYLSAEAIFDTVYCHPAIDKKRYYDSQGGMDTAAFEADITALSTLDIQVVRYFREESILRQLLCYLRFKRALKSRAAELRIILRDSLIELTPDFVYKKTAILDKTHAKIEQAKEIIKGIKGWRSWKQEHQIKGNPPKDEPAYWEKEYSKINAGRVGNKELSKPNCFYDELDIGWRHKAFQLAMHYWEGRWLLKLEEDLVSDIFTGKNEVKSKNRWGRQAMLTPCFVSTFYMAPKFFNSSKFLQYNDNGDPIYDNPPLVEFIDLLIVDEAGQVSPEVGMPTFSMARQAVVVGDVKQIEPVYNITHKMDIGNLRSIGLIKDYDDLIYEKVYDPKGRLASSGSIMKVAQNACAYQEKGLAEKGILLVEHRRCYDEIINYCNILAYDGLLKPLKGKGTGLGLFPPMYCIHVEGRSTASISSRHNQEEANAIATWLQKNRQVIEKKYNKKLELVVGIITPFVGQKYCIGKALGLVGVDTTLMKVGTVHALQGAERPIIILSTVYGPGDVGTMFFDRDNKPNMLNVAVSRAEDHFIVFANTRIFNKEVRNPSGILAAYLTYDTA